LVKPGRTKGKKPLRGKPSKPSKVIPKKPLRSKPLRGKPVKSAKVKPKKAKKPPVKKAPPPPPKKPLPQLFGKHRGEVLYPIRGEVKERVQEAEGLIEQARKRGKKATSISEIGYEYYQLIAAIEKMTPHDIYTLFMSP